MTISLLTGIHTSAASSDDNNVTTTAKDTSTAKLIVLSIAYLQGVSFTITDSTSANTFTRLTAQEFSGSAGGILAYCVNPTTSTTHTFTVSSTGAEPGVAMAAYTATGSIAYTGETSGNKNNGTTVAPGSITPALNNCLLVAVASTAQDMTSVNSSFTLEDHHASGSFNWGVALADIVQTTAGAANPTFTTVAANNTSTMAVFKEVVGGKGLSAYYGAYPG